MAVSMIGPKFYAWDKNGNPLAFGKLYTYLARTNSPKPTFQSEDQAVENANPVVLNGEGYANVYLDGAYKMVLKDSDENEIWSSDPVTSSSAEEWNNCLPATYLSSISLKVSGNFVSEYDKGRKIRINNNTPQYAYATIVDSSYAGLETTIIVSEPLVTTGIVDVCSSIVGVDSSLNLDDIYTATFKSSNGNSAVSNMLIGLLSNGITIQHKEGNVYSTGATVWIAKGTNTGSETVADFDPITDLYAMDFGAKFDYLLFNKQVNPSYTDDTVALQTAINALPYGGVIKCPWGSAAITSLTSTGRYANITIAGQGRESTELVGVGSAGEWMILTKFENDYFGATGLRDITIRGVQGNYDVNGISTEFTLGNHFENVGFKYLDTCHRGINSYQGSYNNIRFWEYNTGLRGLTAAEGAVTGQNPDSVPFAEATFTSLYFYGANTVAQTGKAVISTGFNGCSFVHCTFAGNTLAGLDLSIGGGGFRFYSCRFERMKANVTWVTVGFNCKFYGCEVFTDGGNCWWTPSVPDSDTWAFKITGSGNYIDGITPEFPRQIIKLEGGSSNNEVTWKPGNGDNWDETTWFYNPIFDEGDNNIVNIGHTDTIVNRVSPKTERAVSSVMVGTNDQSCFTVLNATKAYDPLVISKGPYSNESVYEYTNPTGDRIVYGSPTGLVAGAWYCYSMWVATSDFANLGAFEVFLGEDVFVGENFSRVQMSSNNKWVRVFKMFKTTGTTLNCGFRMATGATGNLYVSQPQLVFCGYEQSDIVVGAFVPAVNAPTQMTNPDKTKAYNLVDKSGSRALGNTYTNTSGKEITIYVSTRNSTSSSAVRVYINGILALAYFGLTANLDFPFSFPVKPGETYKIEWSAAGGSITDWLENI